MENKFQLQLLFLPKLIGYQLLNLFNHKNIVIRIPDLNPIDFRYELPDSFIPDRPLDERDASKLLVYKNGSSSEWLFNEIVGHLPPKSFLVFNNSKVIPARLIFQTKTGAHIEILCLQPVTKEIHSNDKKEQRWKCIIGNLKRWKQDALFIKTELFVLEAQLLERGGEENVVSFKWDSDFTFLEILEKLGQIPLPPYMNRKADESDAIRYQTVYASNPGSVAAPTAGLHFTESVLGAIKANGHEMGNVTLHVGAGTFRPIKSDNVIDHKMHQEFFEVDRGLIVKLLENEAIIPVGTTSMRTLESLFHLGNRLINGKTEMRVDQWDGFETEIHSKNDCLNALINWMDKNGRLSIVAETSVMIVPGYQFRMCKGIVTNFHQPESTLILLVAALLGEKWREVYDFAIKNKFRFLSYGDSSLLLP